MSLRIFDINGVKNAIKRLTSDTPSAFIGKSVVNAKEKQKKIEIKKSFIWLFHSNLGPPTKRKPHSLDLNHYALFFRPESIRQLLWDPKLGRAHLWDSNLESSNSELMRYTNR